MFLHPDLARSMFRDRKTQFVDRLHWRLDVDAEGMERDQYDAQNPLYVIIQNENGLHDASLRLIPTTQATMINDYFSDALTAGPLHQADTWECTRFCISPSAASSLSIDLLAATSRLMMALDIHHLVAVFDRYMRVQYRRDGVAPTILGSMTSPEGQIFAGRWSFHPAVSCALMRRARLSEEDVTRALADATFAQPCERMRA